MSRPVGINPRVDCVFLMLMGNPENKDILLDFLNSILQPEVPFLSVEILNPHHSPLHLSGKASVLDVKARDANGNLFQVEMQNLNIAALPTRMVFNNAEMFVRQGKRGQDYAQLRPAISIWLLNDLLFSDAADFHHCFQLYDARNQRRLSAHMQIHTLELERWRRGISADAQVGERRWMDFFSYAEHWAQIPSPLSSPPLEKAMTTLKQFLHNEDWYRIYASEEDALNVQITIQNHQLRTQKSLQEAEQSLQKTLSTLQETQGALQETQGALQETQGALQETQGALQETQGALREAEQTLEETRDTIQQKDAALMEKEAELARLREILQRLQASPSD